ncbi:methyl-accepting chemotaxis protein [Paenibacillus hamazuiensis]|uniref:methyl-accepting chemotaxis protein n=1 Tax=Paenibacillus hamazuiensis TaxID=2936508 RepID=UPI00200D47A9|nr:methyl-accepting chemotaxis protein [Paenibacillus hamazuiensis]
MREKLKWGTMWGLKNSIKAKLVVGCLLLSLVPLLITTLILTKLSNSATTLEANDKEIKVAQDTSRYVDYWIQNKINVVQNIMKAHPEFKAGDKNHILSVLKQIGEVDQEVEYYAYVDKDANSTNWSGQTSNVAEREYYIKAKSTKKPAISDMLINQKTGKYIIVVSVPLLDGDNFLGTINCVLNPTILGNLTNQIKIGNTGLGYLWSESGTFISHPKEDHYGKKMDDFFSPEQVQQFKDTVFQNDVGTVDFVNSEGKHKLAAYSTVPTTGWKVMVTQDSQEVYAARDQFLKICVVILVVACILVVLVSLIAGRQVSKPLLVISGALRQAAEGDLTSRLGVRTRDEIGQISESVNVMFDSISAMIRQVNQTSEHLAASSEELTAISAQNVESSKQIGISLDNVVGGSEKQAQAAQQNVAAMEEMSVGITRIAGSAASVSDAALSSSEEAKQGNVVVQKAVAQMDAIQTTVKRTSSEISQLGELSSKIGEIVHVIGEIANQTQMLSLNASIEAARAGEHGRGFSVVANEVKKLADQTKTASANIAELIEEVQKTTDKAIHAMQEGVDVVDSGTQLMTQVGSVFETIYSSIQHVTEQIQEISASTEQISAGTEQVTSSMNEVASISDKSFTNAQAIAASSQEQLASMEEISASSETLSQMAQELQETLSKFIVR